MRPGSFASTGLKTDLGHGYCIVILSGGYPAHAEQSGKVIV